MAAIADLQAESIDSNVNQLTWTSNGEANTLKRSLHGAGSYSDVATVTGLATYQDASAATGVYYDYKITSVPSGDSNVSSVVTQVCSITSGAPAGDIVGQYAQDQVTTEDFNSLIDQLNQKLQAENSQLLPCEVCPSNGAIVLDCTTCSHFIVNVTENINSISMVGCGNVGDGSITFQVPANTTVKICGFPQLLGFDGGECSSSPGTLSGGTSGTSYRVRFGGSSTGGQSAGGGLTRTLTSKGSAGGTKRGSALQLTCYTAVGGANSRCSIDCPGVKQMTMIASGGVPPYSFSATGSLSLSVSGDVATISPPNNAGSGVGGTAYTKQLCYYPISPCNTCNAPNFAGRSGIDYTCADAEVGGGGCGNGTATKAPCGTAADCLATGTVCVGVALPCETQLGCRSGDSCTNIKQYGTVTDVRTPTMISNGCNPCGISAVGKVVTVRDATGAQVSKTVLQ